MELMTKYQYTYFIYPYVIDSKKYNKYMLKLLKNKRCKLRIFEKEKDMHLYNYFLPEIKENIFWSFGLTKEGIRSFNQSDMTLQANLLSKQECNIFQYQLEKDLQGKVGQANGIFFTINEIKIICFKTGICFLVLKTTLQEDDKFANILNFNYKFREINSKTYNLKEYENIKIQSDIFKDIKEISLLIKEITGSNHISHKMNVDGEKFIAYSYTCLDQTYWNENGENESIETEFIKYRKVLPANKQVAEELSHNDDREIYYNKYVKYGISSTSTVLLTTDINTENYTTIAQKYESEYLYTYILVLYKKYLLNNLSVGFNKTQDFKNVENQFLKFVKKLWIQDITNDDFARCLIKKWENILDTEETFIKLKSKYDVLYKKYNVESSNKNNRVTLAVISVVLVFNIISIIISLLKWLMEELCR